MLRIAVLDDHPAVLAGLGRLLDAEPDVTVVAAAPTVADLARRLEGMRPDVLVLDYDLGRGDGLAHCRRVKNRPDPPRVIIYSAYAGAALALAARAAGADAVVDKSEPVQALLAAIHRVAQGGTAVPTVPPETYDAALGRLEDEDLPILAMLMEDEPVSAIAEALRTDRAEIARRTQRIVGRLRPRVRTRPEEEAIGRAGHAR